MTTFPILFLTASLNFSPAGQTIHTSTPESPQQWQCTNSEELSNCSRATISSDHIKLMMVTTLEKESGQDTTNTYPTGSPEPPKPTASPKAPITQVVSSKKAPKSSHAPQTVPTATPEPTTATLAPPSTPQPPKTPPTAESLMSAVNQYRNNIGKPAFQTHPQLCEVANQRKPELNQEIFGPNALHQGFRQKQLPYRATENMIHQQTTQQALNWWLNSSIHRKAIESDHTYACTACQDGSCAMIFSSFQPK